jgi:hypothetical protein
VQQELNNVLATIHESDYPIVAKPVRGRGSYGVKICCNPIELSEHVAQLLDESPCVLLEEYLNGEEGTITIMPPSHQSPPGSEWSDRYASHWALPPVTRFNHVDGVAPYSGKVAVTVNSRAVSSAEVEADPAYSTIMKECEKVGSLLQTTAPLRIDIRRFGPRFGPDSNFALFDINMKPVCAPLPRSLLCKKAPFVSPLTRCRISLALVALAAMTRQASWVWQRKVWAGITRYFYNTCLGQRRVWVNFATTLVRCLASWPSSRESGAWKREYEKKKKKGKSN